jgi:hypothetical protein
VHGNNALIISYIFSSTDSGQAMYIHVSKCKTDKIKGKKEHETINKERSGE